MKKKNSIAITLILLTVVGLWGVFSINKHYYTLWNANTVEVKTDQKLDVGKVKIFFGISVNTISRTNDEAVFMEMDKYLTVFDGSDQNKIFNEYGENDFLVTYDDKYYLTFRHFKTRNRAQHEYQFNFTKKGNKVLLNVDIEGRDNMKFSHEMIPIAKAKKHRTNVPLDRAGTVFNGVELY